MRPSELTKMFELEDSYWWFVARRKLILTLVARYLPPTPAERPVILDIGCGTGATLTGLSRFGDAFGVDFSRHALQYCRRRDHCALVRSRGEALPFADASAHLITALDLLEHIPDDAAAVREFARVLRPGGVLLITVPAGPMLWSEHDEALDHLRRYRSRELRRALEGAGLEVERLSPCITFLLLPIALLRFLQRLWPRRRGGPQTALIVPPKGINTLLIKLLALEHRWLLRFNLPAGVSLLAVARKRGPALLSERAAPGVR